MAVIRIDQQVHGYRYGHELLGSTVKLASSDQDVIDRLSDMSGALRPGETFNPYLTAYPLPSRRYYVLARTWQDLAAPRAGCVQTRSALIPIEEWEVAASPAAFLQVLEPVESTNVSLQQQVVEPSACSFPPVTDPRVGELVEAMFLENRQPTVMFEAAEAELIALRLLTALWPALRSSFSICTFALSPRTVSESRLFDLIFAPKNARNRFAEWTGRRIEGAMTASSARHRWTATATRQIFLVPVPSLTALDSLGALRSDKKGDEAALRLALLWHELVEKSKNSPSAVLGLLDILSAQGMTFHEAADVLTPLAEASIRQAAATLPTTEAWTFLIALLGKFPQLLPPRSILRRVKEAAFDLTNEDPMIAVGFIASHCDEARPVPAVIAAGLGRGLANRGLVDVFQTAHHYSRQTLLRLLAYSPPFARIVSKSVNAEASNEWVENIALALTTRDTDLRNRARRNILPVLNNAAQVSLLDAVLADVSPKSLATAVAKVWEKTRFSVAAFDDAFWRAARGEEGILALRESILAVADTEESNRFLASTLRLDVADLCWLCSNREMEPDRVVQLLTKLLEQGDEYSIQAIARQSSTSKLIVNALMQRPLEAATQIGRLLVAGQVDVEDLFIVGRDVLPGASQHVQKELAHSMLFRGFAEGGDSVRLILSEILGTLAKHVDISQVVLAATAVEVSQVRLSENIILLGQTSGSLRDGILSHIGMLTDRLTSRRTSILSAKAVAAWAELLGESGNVDRDSQITAAAAALPFALRNIEAPNSPLVVTAFPIVYQQLKAGNEPSGLLAYFFFQDWDRCRTARGNLVQAYMRSSWPPADLLLTATIAGDAQRVLKHVSNEFNGAQYMQAMYEDLERLPDSIVLQLRQQLDAFELNR